MSLPRTIIALAFGATMLALFDPTLSPTARFHALFSQPPEVGMRRKDADGQRPLFAEEFVPRPRERKGDETSLVFYFFEVYCKRLKNRFNESGHPANARRVLERFVEYCGLHEARLRDVTNLDLEDYLAARKKDTWRGNPLAARTLNNEIDILNDAFVYAGPRGRRLREKKYLGWLSEPPWCERVEEPKLSPIELDDRQIQTFLTSIDHATAPRIAGCSPRDFWLCVLILDSLTLLRRRALLLVKRPDDETLLVKKRLFIPASINKTKEDVYVTLGTDDTIAQLLAKLPTQPGEPLLPWKTRDGRPMSAGYFNQHMKDFQRRAGVPEIDRLTLKNFRSTSANKAEDAADETTAKAKLKHAPNTNTYGKHYRSRRPRAAEIQATDVLKDWLFGVIRTVGDGNKQQPELKVIG